MPYPISPFAENIDNLILDYQLKCKINANEKIQNENYLNKLLKWLCTSPNLTSFRFNNNTFKLEEIKKLIENEVQKIIGDELPKIEIYPDLPDLILLHNCSSMHFNLNKEFNEIVVDVNCAAAILRGAHIFAPGVISMLPGAKINDKVSIYADLEGKCRKGYAKIYRSPNKLFIGNGLIKMSRDQLFGADLVPSGVAVQITDRVSGCLSINENLFPSGSVILQNVPSVICVHALNVKPELTVLDMCAAPGNKTTHIANLMQNKGILIAIDKTPSKIKCLKETCEIFGAKAQIFKANSINILDTGTRIDECNILSGPPFPKESFDRILLDAPCSALGKRPLLANNISETVLKAYVPLQRKLFETAVHLLKKDGYIVYSTCTITIAENEAIVAWALKTFNCLQLVKPEPYLGGPGLFGTSLTETERLYVQRFGPDEIDSVGFFYSLFIKSK